MDGGTRRGRLLDAALAGGVAAVGVAEIWVPFPSVLGEGSSVLSTVLVLLLTAPLALRRRWPLPVAVVVLTLWPLVFTVTPVLVLFWGQFVPMAVAVFSVARWGRGREPWWGAGVAAASLLFLDLRVEVLSSPGEIVFHWMVFVVVWSFGWALRRFEQRARLSLQRAVEVEVRAAEQALSAVLAERTRIARELHDVVAHSVSVMVVQAGAAEQVVDDDPETVRQALAAIRTTGNASLAEMRRVVAMLREDDETGQLSPQPGLGTLPGLLEETRRAGLATELVVEGEPRALPVGVDLAAYRIVQEALTNVRRHARAGTAQVLLRYDEHAVGVEVVDDGVGPGGPADPPDQGPGHGLVGMRERVGLYGGRLETSAPAGGGFAVRAWIPVEQQ